MKNKMKRILAFVVAFVMVFTMMPGNNGVSKAADSGNTNTGRFDFNHLGSNESANSVSGNVLSFEFDDGAPSPHDATLSITKDSNVVSISDNSNSEQKHFETADLTTGDVIEFKITYDEGQFPGLEINGTPYSGTTTDEDGKRVTRISYTCDFPSDGAILSPGVVGTDNPGGPGEQASGPISYHVIGDNNADKISNPVCTIKGVTEGLSSVWPEEGVVTYSLQVEDGYEIIPSTLDICWEFDDPDNPDKPGGVRLNLSSELKTAIVEGLVSPEGYTFSRELDIFKLEKALITIDQNPRMRIEFAVNQKFDDKLTLHFYKQDADGYDENGNIVYRDIEPAKSAEDMHLENFTFNGNALVINEGIAQAGGYVGEDKINELNFFGGFGTIIDAVYVSKGDVSNPEDNNMELVTPTGTDEHGADQYNIEVPGVEYSILVVYGLPDDVNLKWSYLEQYKDEDFFVENGTVEVTKVVRDGETIYPYPDEQEPQCTVDVDGFGGEVFLKRGDTVTLKLIPNAGYQLKSANLNGSLLTADEDTVSTFEVTMNGNLHFAGTFVKAEDSVEVDSESLEGAQIMPFYDEENPEADMSVIDSGTLGLTIKDNNSYENKEAALDEAGEGAEAVAVIDMELENLVSKGINDAEGSKEDNYWVEELSELRNPVAVEVDLGPDSELGLDGDETFAAIREHMWMDENGEIQTTIENIGGWSWVDEETGHRILAITTDRFSTYTIVKEPCTEQPGEPFASYEGIDFYEDEDGDVRAYDEEGNPVIDEFKCDGTYTYYFQFDGTAMKDRLTYHPDGIHVIYFDENGHEVFNNFANVKKSIEGNAVDDYCYFDVYGYMYVDVVTYDVTGTYLYYINPYGVMERKGWFQFSETVKCADGTPWNGAALNYGCAMKDGKLIVNRYVIDWLGRWCYLQGNGVALYF